MLINENGLLFTMICYTLVSASPQLDLPILPPPSSARPEIILNSFPQRMDKKKLGVINNVNYDSDRSERFGPPYDSNEDKETESREKVPERSRNYKDYLQNATNSYIARNQQDGSFVRFDDSNFRNYNGRNEPFYPNGGNPYNNDPNDFYDPNQYDVENDRRIRIENEKLKQLLFEIDKKSNGECTLNVASQWNYESNINPESQLAALAAQQRYADFQKSVWAQLKEVDKSFIYDEELFRQINLMLTIGPTVLPADQLDRYNRLLSDMLVIHNSATICGYQQPFNCELRLHPEIKDIMARSRDWDELAWTWTEWRRKSGKPIRDLYEQLIDLTNDAAYLNNYTNAGIYWMSSYDSYNFKDEMDEVWKEIEPLYELLHAYVRRKLREYYGPDKINRNAPLPDHILGNVYSQSWANILDITVPYPGRSYLEVTPAMRAQGYTPLLMFQLADEFFASINMTIMPKEFWINSIFEQPPDRPILCQPSAWDFCNGQDFRIRMCTDITHKDLISVHREMAHIQYFINYREKPKVFRDGANPGFHEAIADAIALSVATPKHLQNLGLVQKSVDDVQHDINYLFAIAIDKVVFLPFALALENWRYDIFSKKINKEQYNCHWWLLRELYGGIKPPVLRSEMDFDPGSKYHVPANVPYMKYFFAAILQFQIHRSLCIASGEYNPSSPSKPLHKCDIYRHPEAGNLLKKLMEKGASQSWQKTLQEVLGEGRLDGSALREFFKPLEEWLRNENLRNQEFIGWIYDGDYCKRSIETANLQVYGGFYNRASALNLNMLSFVLISIHFVLVNC